MENRPLEVSYLYGASGAGKTRSIYETHDPGHLPGDELPGLKGHFL